MSKKHKRSAKASAPPIAEPAATPPLPSKGIKVSLAALANHQGRTTTAINPFTLPRYPKGVLPDGQTQMAMDDANTQIVTAFDFGTSFHGLFAEGIGFFGYPYLAELAQRAEYRRASEIIAEEMTRKWIKIKAAGEDDKSEKVAQLEEALQKFRVREVFRDALEHDGFFGRGQIFLDYGDEDNEILQTRLVHKAEIVGKGRLKRLTVIDPTWTAPNRYSSSDPTQPTFYAPQSWFIMGREIHNSRLLTFISRPLPDILKPAYNFGGLSLSQMMKPYVDNWLRTRQAVSDLVNSFTIFTLETNLQGLLAGAGGDDEKRRLDILAQTRDNRGLLVVNNTADNTEKISNTSAPLGTLDHLQAQSQEQICSVIAVPLVKYLGVTPSGLNASADGEIRVFYDGIHARQERVMGDHVRTILQLIQLDIFGEVDDDIDFEFVPLWELDEQGAATVRKTNADTDAVLAEQGAIDADEIRVRVASELGSPYAGLDLTKPAPGPPAGAGMEGGELPPDGGGDDGIEQALVTALTAEGADSDLAGTIARALASQGSDTGMRSVMDALTRKDSGMTAVLEALRRPTPNAFIDALISSLAADAAWTEGDHPRDAGGRFLEG